VRDLAASVVILALVFSAPSPVPATPPLATVAVSTPRPLSASSTADLLSDAVAADDPSLALVADLTDSLGWDAAADAGLAADGSAEHAITHLSPVELQELEGLLKEVLGPKGA